MEEPAIAKLLIVDDEVPQMEALCSTLESQGYLTEGFASAEKALESLRDRKFDVVISDLMMPEMDGIELLKAALQVDSDLAGIIMTGRGSIDSAVRAMQSGALDYIQKPFKLSAILPVISRALTVRQLRLDNVALQDKIRQRTLELEIANKDLEAFTYSVSHDLRSPLRHILGFLEVIAEDCSQETSLELQEMLAHIQSGAVRMSALIDDLLRFSRLGKQALSVNPVKLNELVHSILNNMQEEQNKRMVEVKVSDLPDCMGDEALLRQVYVNLLSNAFKFTRNSDHAIVEIGCIQSGGENTYFVKDNGSGFDAKHAQGLFEVFKRFHPVEQFEGTGVGLSIVQRIVKRHGGEIWAESMVDKGAAFYFRLRAIEGCGS